MNYTRKHVAKSHLSLPRLMERDIKWLTFVNRHGPLSSTYLHEYTSGTHRCKDTALRRLQWLCEQGMLFCPPQQKSALYAPFNPYIYDLTNSGYDALYEAGIAANSARPTGHFPHLFLTACVTSSLDMNANADGQEYIEAETILDLKNSQLGIPTSKGKLIPDQLFALKSASGYRVFALEMDRGTEPIVSAQVRKSYQRSIQQYREVVERKLHRSHYGLSGHLLIFWVFTSRRREEAFREFLDQNGGLLKQQCFTESLLISSGGWRPPKRPLGFAGPINSVLQ